jgi:copper chaperone CopZ
MPNITLPNLPPAREEYDAVQITQNMDDIVRTLQQIQDVVGVTSVGWTAPTGTASKAGFDTATATTTQLAQTLKAVVDHLIAKGDFEP